MSKRRARSNPFWMLPADVRQEIWARLGGGYAIYIPYRNPEDRLARDREIARQHVENTQERGLTWRQSFERIEKRMKVPEGTIRRVVTAMRKQDPRRYAP